MKTTQDLVIKKSVRLAGFTLLEIMASVSIIAIVFISVFKMHTQTVSMSGRVRFNAIAPLLAQGKLADYELTSKEDLSDDSGDFGEKHPGYRWRISISDVESDMLEDTAEDLKRIDVFVSYAQEDSFQLRTYRFFSN